MSELTLSVCVVSGIWHCVFATSQTQAHDGKELLFPSASCDRTSAD